METYKEEGEGEILNSAKCGSDDVWSLAARLAGPRVRCCLVIAAEMYVREK